jgi:hypothetical protein
VGAGRAQDTTDFGFGKSEIFSPRVLNSQIRLIWLAKFVFEQRIFAAWEADLAACQRLSVN